MGHSSEAVRQSYAIDPARTAVLIAARSNMGPVEMVCTDVSGRASAGLRDGVLDTTEPYDAFIEMHVESLSSGKPLYDNEIHRRLDAQRYPKITAQLVTCTPLNDGSLALNGSLTIHGQSRALDGQAVVERFDESAFILVGEQAIDIREFSISLPTALMMRIYPDVVVAFRIEATATSTSTSTASSPAATQPGS